MAVFLPFTHVEEEGDKAVPCGLFFASPLSAGAEDGEAGLAEAAEGPATPGESPSTVIASPITFSAFAAASRSRLDQPDVQDEDAEAAAILLLLPSTASLLGITRTPGEKEDRPLWLLLPRRGAALVVPCPCFVADLAL